MITDICEEATVFQPLPYVPDTAFLYFYEKLHKETGEERGWAMCPAPQL